ncbi:hypothetical protein N7457_008157 [Penicillium paradoxum]|uniref:uncharacterized protein n=1 Tax=Penicillium paradoxum TaxID=176176 RepID=UPI0025488B4A|nr:uncharacterized protein N7457_008157 [Penicillium paradoxum]KAJ5773261.1 hypothetical protein N7457_008157 [Penicillium paradoxum]
MMDLLNQDIYSYDSLHNPTLLTSDIKKRDNEPALASSMVIKNLRLSNETEGYDFALHHWENGMGQLHLSHDAFSSNGSSASNHHKRFDGSGFKIAFHKVAGNVLYSTFVDLPLSSSPANGIDIPNKERMRSSVLSSSRTNQTLISKLLLR